MAEQKCNGTAEAHGRRLAVWMLREMSSLGSDELSIDGEFREGRPQADVLVRYLSRARSQGPAVEAAFLAVLTDVLGSYADGQAGHTLAQFFETLSD